MQKMADSSVYDTPDIKHDDVEIYDKPNISNSDNYYNKLTLNQPHQHQSINDFEDPDNLNNVKPNSRIKSLIKNRKFIGITMGLMLSILLVIALIIVVVYFTVPCSFNKCSSATSTSTNTNKNSTSSTNDPIKTFRGYNSSITALTLLDSDLFASSSLDRFFRKYNTNAGPINEYNLNASILSMVTLKSRTFSSTSKFVCAGRDDGSIVILDATNQISKANEWQAHEKKVTSLALFQNDLLASGSDSEIKLWNASASIPSKKSAKREINSRAQFFSFSVYPESVNALVFLENGILVSGTSGSYSGHIYVWDLNFESALFSLDTKSEVNALCVIKNGYLASGLADGLVKIWNLEKRELVKTLTGHSKSVKSLAILNNGYLASGSDDKTIKIWDTDTEKEVKTLFGHEGGVTTLIVNTNGYLVSGSSDFSIKIWNFG